jgi:biotin operon repressor
MNKYNKQIVKSRLLKLARMECTGSPADLAHRFEMSERSIKRFIKELRDEGNKIKYSPSRVSYVTEDY